MRIFLVLISSLLCLSATLPQEELEHLKLATLYSSLDPTSVAELFAFYELYPQSTYGQAALKRVWDLFHVHQIEKGSTRDGFFLPALDIQAIIALVNKQPYEQEVVLTDEQLLIIDSLAAHLHHRSLKGHALLSREAVLSLQPEEVDLARALLLYQYENIPSSLTAIRQYEASLDLMALQILARLPETASDIEKIDAINHFIFHEMQFRFPPHSLMAKDIDLYTFLPSVLDSRQGVCLGVSILYLSLAQRLNLPLEIITPPGHIYVRYHQKETLINIETTARGIHIPSENYLSINQYALEKRNIKEVVGMAFFNQASVLSAKKDYPGAIELYEKAKLFMPGDPHVIMFLGLHKILADEREEGFKLLREIVGKPSFGEVYPDTLLVDILQQNISKEALEAIFMRVDETRASIVAKQQALQKAFKKYPRCRAVVLQLAISWLQLGRAQEALDLLKHYNLLDAHDPTVQYYLCALSIQRLHYQDAWKFFVELKKILAEKNHTPRTLRHLEYELRYLHPETIHKDCILLEKLLIKS